MYYLQRQSVLDECWFDVTRSSDYTYICELCRLYTEKFKDNVFRVVEVFVYV